MIYEQLFKRTRKPETVIAGLIGCGDFGSAIISQGSCVPRLKIQFAADVDIENARKAYHRAGVTDDRIVVCDSRKKALSAMEAGKYVILEDGMLLMELPVHVVTTATRSPEAGARYIYEAIKHGKNVVMVDKEADSVAGPFLKRMADKAGLVFTTDDGDEPGLLMGLVGWARSLGMEVLSGGNTHEVIYDPAASTVTSRGHTLKITDEDKWMFGRIPEGQVIKYTDARRKFFDSLRIDEECGDPMCHMAVSANGTGLLPDEPFGHRPALSWREMPEVLCPVEEGGINKTRGTVDIPSVIRTAEEPNYGGSVYIVISCANRHAMDKMIDKGLMPNRRKTTGVLYRPYHLCGAETSMSIMCAGLLGVPTGASEIRQHVDIICTARRTFKAGEAFGPSGTTGWNRDLRASLIPGFKVGPGKPVPFFMLEGHKLAKDVPQGSVITWDMMDVPENSVLWNLRQQQDEIFFGTGVDGK